MEIIDESLKSAIELKQSVDKGIIDVNEAYLMMGYDRQIEKDSTVNAVTTEKSIYNIILDIIKEKAYRVNIQARPVYGQGQYDMAYEILDAVEKIIITENKTNGWITLIERLPENQPSWISGTTYIITRKYNNRRKVEFVKYKEKKWIDNFGKIISDCDVAAWKPLPEPYKESAYERE